MPGGLAWAGETRDGYCQPLERAELVRPGKDVTILCYSRMRYVVMQAVQQLEKQGYDPEVRLEPGQGRIPNPKPKTLKSDQEQLARAWRGQGGALVRRQPRGGAPPRQGLLRAHST